MDGASCGWVRRFLGPWQDGELDPADASRIERHIAGCPACAGHARFERWFSAEVRRLADRPRAPGRLADRISLGLRREERRRRFRRAVVAFGGLAAAAALAAVVAVGVRGSSPAAPSGGGRSAAVRDLGAGGVPPSTPSAPPGFAFAGMGGEESLGPVLVDRHERAVGQAMPLELASDDPDAVSSWFRGKVSFPVAAPRFGRSDVRLLGARLTHVGADDAAYLAYRVQDHPLSVLVFPAGLRPAAGRDVRVVGDRRIYTSRRGGLAWVLFDSGGLTYALVSDLPEALLLELATRIR